MLIDKFPLKNLKKRQDESILSLLLFGESNIDWE